MPSLALAARAETSELMAESPLVWALNTMGVIRPLTVLTATLTSTTWFLRGGENRAGTDVRERKVGKCRHLTAECYTTLYKYDASKNTHWRITVSIQEELHSGTLRQARALALIMKSFTLSLMF